MAKKKKTTADELSELDKTYRKVAGQQKKKEKTNASSILIIAACAVLLIAIGVGVWFLFSDNWLTMQDVTVAGINLNGMTKREAKEALTKLAEERYTTETMVITVQDTTLELTAEDADIRIDVNEAINDAYGQTGQFDLTPYITINKKSLQAVVDEFGALYNAELRPTVYTVEGTAPSLTSPEPEEGTGQTLILELGSPELGLDTSVLSDQILDGYSTGNFHVTGDCTVIPPEMPTADELYEKYLTPAVDAVMDEKTFVITPETYGYSIDPEIAEELLSTAQYGDRLEIPFAIVMPETTEEILLSGLFQDVLGECSTPYSGSDTNNRNTNLGLACEKINGVILLPGETFSYNATLGERTKENGWKPAASYVNGLTVDTYGGGICQGSTTLYNCVLLADLKITECYPHGYISSYVEPGLDASVNWPSADFKFVNTSGYPIKLEAYRQNGRMTMRIYGTDDKDYYVKMTYSVIGSTPYKVVYQEVDPENNPKGYKDGQELVSPYTGYRVKTYKNKYDKETDELIETTLERDFTYSHRDQVIVKFVTKTETPPETTEPTEETTPTTP